MDLNIAAEHFRIDYITSIPMTTAYGTPAIRSAMETSEPTVLEEAIEKAPRNKYGLIFYDTNKKDVIATQQVNCYFKRLCHKANIDVRGQHALRHTFATRCIEAGIPAVVLKEWMGHTNIHITLDTYADVFNRMNNEAIKMFEKYTCAIKHVEKTT